MPSVFALFCQPIPQLGQLLMGGMFVTGSLIWLAIAVAFKAGLFAFLTRKQLSGLKAIGLMLLGNVVSTIVGIFLAVAAASGPMIVVAFFLGGILAYIPAKRLKDQAPWERVRKLPPAVVALSVGVGALVSPFLFYLADGVGRADQLVAYWALKYVYVVVAISVSLLMTTLWEEYVIGRIAKSQFYAAALRANLYMLVLVMGAAAVQMLPERLRNRGFLALGVVGVHAVTRFIDDDDRTRTVVVPVTGDHELAGQ